ncbi:MAG: PRC-barrel domain-containing protein [Halobacteria archaeon]|nr:PRC-barrel domain-containing protein [Halobacteria archaeon]
MSKVLAMNLTDMRVMGDDGTEIGDLHNITCDLETGKLGDLVIEPSQKGRELYDTDAEGNVKIPTRRLTAVKDYIVVKR